MSGNNTWMPLYIGDYLTDTGHLSTAEHGAYLLLLMHYWRNGPLPNDQASLLRIVRAQAAEWRRIKTNVLAFFTLNGDGLLHQKRMDQERNKLADVSEKRREAGRAGAEAKWRANGAEHPPSNPPDGMANAIPRNGKCHPVAIGLPPDLPSHIVQSHSELEAGERKESKCLNNLTFLESPRPSACEAEAVSEPRISPPETSREATAQLLAFAAISEKLGRTFENVELAQGRPSPLDRAEQIAVVAGIDTTLRRSYRRPQEPVRSVEEQLAMLRQGAA